MDSRRTIFIVLPDFAANASISAAFLPPPISRTGRRKSPRLVAATAAHRVAKKQIGQITGNAISSCPMTIPFAEESAPKASTTKPPRAKARPVVTAAVSNQVPE